MKVRISVYSDGLIAGIIGAAVIAYLVPNPGHSRWSTFLHAYCPGNRTLPGPKILPRLRECSLFLNLILMYTWVQVLVFVMLGEIAAYLLWLTGKNPNLGFCLFLFALLEFGFVSVAFVFAEPLPDHLAWPAVDRKSVVEG